MFKKVIAIMTASVLAASILVGCGGSTGASSSAPAEQKTEEAAPAEAAEPAADQAAAATDGDLAKTATLQPRKSAFAFISSLITS